MWDKVIEFLKDIETIILYVIPLAMALWFKIKTSVIENKLKLNTKDIGKRKQQLLEYKHSESIEVISKLKEVCNYHCDLSHVHASYIQLENGTIATSKLCNMFFSCIAEDSRYSNLPKLTEHIQRIPFVRLSNWFNKVYTSEHQVVYVIDSKDIDAIFQDTIKIKCMVSGLVKNPKGVVIGVCNFMFSEEQEKENLDNFVTQMTKFVSSVETIFLDYNVNIKNKAKDLKIPEEID